MCCVAGRIVETALADREFLLKDKLTLADLFFDYLPELGSELRAATGKFSADLSRPNHSETCLPACG